MMNVKDATLLTHASSNPDACNGAVNPPIYRASTIILKSYADFERIPNVDYYYGRIGTPTSKAFEEAMAAFDGAYKSIATQSGLSAIMTVLMAFSQAGGHILITDNSYGTARKPCAEILKKLGVEVEYFPPMIGADIQKLFRPNTSLVFMEAPGSLTFEVQDIGAITAAAKAAGIKTAIDNSWGTPLFLKPLALGIDVAVMSATKYICGHADALLGIISTTEELYPLMKRTSVNLGYCAGSEELNLGLRGLRTLDIRMKEHQRKALEIATELENNPAVKRVLHPALPSHVGHDNWKKYFKGSSGTFGIILKETRKEKFAAMLDHMQVFRMGFSWGGFESLLFPEQPRMIRTAETWAEEGLSLRVHVGFEDINDLKQDLADGLKRLG
jgi:cystathionine beta-lyase